RIAPLIALGAGFSPILTGRENIYANMSILGLSNREIEQRFDDVVDFAEIGDALDAPVQSYSSGMAARLGFACAIHTHPDILLIDEVLVVGDVRFKIKCYRKLHELRQIGTSFIMVSHASGMISTICEEAVYLRKGQCLAYGDALSVINQYEEDLCLGHSQAALGTVNIGAKPEAESMGLDITAVFFRDAAGQTIESPVSGELVYLVIECNCAIATDEVSLVIDVREMAGEGQTLLSMNSADENIFLSVTPGKCEIQVEMPAFGLGMGLYDARIAIRMQKICLLDKLESFKFAVKKAPAQSSNSLFYQSRKWQVCRSRA
ncbi:MAG TPA: ATP-binding cassette domain-containing protein, partial [Allocoleopsis sp.]